MLKFTSSVVLMGSLLLTGSASLSAGDILDPAPEGSFSVVVIPDTQAYIDHSANEEQVADRENSIDNPIFRAHVKWITDHLESQKIVFVSHVGDIVDKNQHRQWKVAQECMDTLHGKVPYGISVGNHDMTASGDSSLFQEYFPKSRFANFDWYGGSYDQSPRGPSYSGNNANSYQLFTAEGIEFIFLHLECNASDDVVAWANQLLSQHSHRRVLITSHMGWGPLKKPETQEGYATAPKGRMQWSKIHGTHGNSPQQLWEKCYQNHSNLLAVFSGDQSRSQAIHASTEGRHGNPIHEILSDYMAATKEGGWLRVYRFLPSENRIMAFTVHPEKGTLCQGTKLISAPSEHQFELSCPLTVPLRSSRN